LLLCGLCAKQDKGLNRGAGLRVLWLFKTICSMRSNGWAFRKARSAFPYFLCVFAPLRALRETRQKFKSLGWFKGLIVVQKVQDKVFSNY